MPTNWKNEISAKLIALNDALAQMPSEAKLTADESGRRIFLEVETEREIWHCSGVRE